MNETFELMRQTSPAASPRPHRRHHHHHHHHGHHHSGQQSITNAFSSSSKHGEVRGHSKLIATKKNIATYEKLVTQPNPLKQESFPLKSIDNYISDTNGWNDLAKRNSTSFHYPYEKTPLNKFTKLKEHMFQKLFQETAPNSRKCKLKCFLKLNGEGVCI